MHVNHLEIINEEFHASRVEGAMYDDLLADAWRHFGTHFFRYNLGIYLDEIRRVIPLRVRLSDFTPSKSQRRVLRKNADLACEIEPVGVTPAIEELFDRHKRRFESGVPESIFDFVSPLGVSVPTPGFQLLVSDGSDLVAASFFDLGIAGVSAIYACFDPDLASRSLGIFTMLKVIEHARTVGATHYYHGYSYEGQSFYDYKKKFSGLECYDWRSGWRAMPRG